MIQRLLSYFRPTEFFLVCDNDCGAAINTVAVRLGIGTRGAFVRELKAKGGRQMLRDRGKPPAGTYDHYIASAHDLRDWPS